jgi:Uncharacterised methyltransferase family (DUF6094)
MRSAARLKLGYYPLPHEEARHIRAILLPVSPYAAVDPCAGDGAALLEITRDTGAQLAGIELDADRAAACAANEIATIHGSAFECRVPAESCSLLYLNPPYDTELGPHSNDRMELVFLEHCYRWVRVEGVLVFVIPWTALGRCARLLASQFDGLRMFRLEHPDSVRFKQVVVFGKRKKAHLRGDPKGADLLVGAGYHPNELPVLNAAVGDRYALPPSAPVSINYALSRSTAMHNARGGLVRKHQKMSGRPVTPLHKGHVGLLACSGMLNGFFGEGESRHIAHWRSVKYVDEFHEDGEQEGETVIRKRERFSHELTLAFADGRILELRETKQDEQE